MAKLNVPFSGLRLKGWPLVFVIGLVLALIAVIDRGGLGDVVPSSGSSACQVRVANTDKDGLRLRTGPATTSPQQGTAANGAQLDATTVVQNGFRQLTDDRWASTQFLVVEPGSRCS